jgi:uncharacterized membrane protein
LVQFFRMTAIAETVFFDATLRPNPPMSRAVLGGVAAVVAATNLAFGLFFVLRGAWPVTPFMGADVVLLVWAFRASSNAANRRERIRLTRSVLSVERQPANGDAMRTALNPYWVRVELEEPVRSPGRLLLASHGRTIRIGDFLAPAQKLSLAQQLRIALRQAREPDFG